MVVDVVFSEDSKMLLRAAERLATAASLERDRNGESELTRASTELLQAVERSLKLTKPAANTV